MIDSTPRGAQVFNQQGKWPSELATGTDRDPENVAPLVVYLASDGAAGVNGQVFHARGFRYTLLAQPLAARAILSDGRWDPEELAEVFPRTLGARLSPPPSIAFGTTLEERPDSEWTELRPGRRFWQTPPPEL